MKFATRTICSWLCMVMLMMPAAWAVLTLITDDTGTHWTGKFQIETSGTWLHDKEREGGGEEREISTLPQSHSLQVLQKRWM